jgi:TRAP-type uncharacterized transport system substrate-binding protein
MGPHRRIRRVLWRWVAPALGVAALGIAIYVLFHTPQPRRQHVTMTAGSTAGTRHHLAELFRVEAESQDVEIELRGTVGSEEALDRVNSRQLDCALVQGGLSQVGRPNVRQVAVLPVEPLHLLVRKELADAVSARLSALEGKTIGVGEVGSGTHTLAVAVLAFAGLTPGAGGRGEYVSRHASFDELTLEPDGDLPDAIFLVSSLPSRRAKALVTGHGYRLVPLPFGEAFSLEALADGEPTPGAAHTIDKGRTLPATIPAFTYGVEPPVPPAALPTLGNRLLLVAHKDLDPRTMERLIGVLFESQLAQRVHPPLDAASLDLPPEFPWHDGAESYRRRNRPVVSGDLMSLAQKGTAILAAAGSGLVMLVGWLLERRKARKAVAFRKVLNEVSRIDEEVTHREEEGNASADELLAARGQLMQLRASALDRYTEGDLDDDHLMACFLLHVNSSRDNLARLIARHRQASARERPTAAREVAAEAGPAGIARRPK